MASSINDVATGFFGREKEIFETFLGRTKEAEGQSNSRAFIKDIKNSVEALENKYEKADKKLKLWEKRLPKPEKNFWLSSPTLDDAMNPTRSLKPEYSKMEKEQLQQKAKIGLKRCDRGLVKSIKPDQTGGLKGDFYAAVNQAEKEGLNFDEALFTADR